MLSVEQREEMWSKMLDELLDGLDEWEEVFTAWEQKFIEDIDTKTDFVMFSDLSSKQRTKLEELWQKFQSQKG